MKINFNDPAKKFVLFVLVVFMLLSTVLFAMLMETKERLIIVHDMGLFRPEVYGDSLEGLAANDLHDAQRILDLRFNDYYPKTQFVWLVIPSTIVNGTSMRFCDAFVNTCAVLRSQHIKEIGDLFFIHLHNTKDIMEPNDAYALLKSYGFNVQKTIVWEGWGSAEHWVKDRREWVDSSGYHIWGDKDKGINIHLGGYIVKGDTR